MRLECNSVPAVIFRWLEKKNTHIYSRNEIKNRNRLMECRVDLPIRWNGSNKDVIHNYWAEEQSGETQKKKRPQWKLAHRTNVFQNFIVVERFHRVGCRFPTILLGRILHGWWGKLVSSQLNGSISPMKSSEGNKHQWHRRFSMGADFSFAFFQRTIFDLIPILDIDRIENIERIAATICFCLGFFFDGFSSFNHSLSAVIEFGSTDIHELFDSRSINNNNYIRCNVFFHGKCTS